MIDVVPRTFFLVQGCNRIGDKIDIHNINSVFGPQRKNRQLCQKGESPHHIELSGGSVTTVA